VRGLRGWSLTQLVHDRFLGVEDFRWVG
jgi:hypothetical protein